MGLRVKINDADFVIPLSAVDKCYEVSTINKLNKFNNLIYFDDEQIPFIDLTEEFAGSPSLFSNNEMVVVQYEEKKVALIVDTIGGKLQAVLKPLGKCFMHMDAVSGATILGDGNIALVLDTNKVVEQYLNKKTLSTCL
jgi:two-component system chemotaxis sensor kinase CheA